MCVCGTLFQALTHQCMCHSLPGPHSPDLDSPSLNNQHAPIPYEQLHHHQMASPGQPSPVASTPGGGGGGGGGVGGYSSGSEGCAGDSLSLPHRIPHPLKSFSVPGPPPQTSAPNTPVPKQHIGMVCLPCGVLPLRECSVHISLSVSAYSAPCLLLHSAVSSRCCRATTVN